MKFNFNYKKIIQWFLVVVLVIFLIFTFVQIITNVWELKREGVISRRNFHKYSSKAQISDIQSWMTFRYVNVIFSLPLDYLKHELNIQDKNYPNISISSQAKKNKINTSLYLSSVQQAVNKYVLEHFVKYE